MKTKTTRKRKNTRGSYGGDHNAIAALHISEILMLLLVEKQLLTADDVIQALEELVEHHQTQREEATTAAQRTLHARIHHSVERFIVQRGLVGAVPTPTRGGRRK